MVTLPIIYAQQRRERLGAGLIISVFQSGTFKLTADDIVCLLLRFVIRGDFPAREDLIRYTARLEGLEAVLQDIRQQKITEIYC